VSTRAFVNGRLFSPRGWRDGEALLAKDGRISAILPQGDPRVREAERIELHGRLLLPGFIDTQVNGGGGVLFNDQPTPTGIAAIGRAHARLGTTGFLPTLISDTLAKVATAIAATDAAIAAGVPGVLGLHIEGPFLSEARKGVHEAVHLQSLLPVQVALLGSLQGGRTLLTLAPERASGDVLQQLADVGVILACGHSNATADEVEHARRHGLRGFTHLFNAMSQLTPREPGVVGAALAADDCWLGIIVDGKHVDPRVLKLALRAHPLDRFMLVTDAMPCVGTDAAQFTLQGRTVRVIDGYCVDEHGTLAGTSLDMGHCVRNAITLLGLDPLLAVRMASEFPADFLGLQATHGRLAAGFRADLVAVDEQYHVSETWIGGRTLAEWPT
jgi:N-acetylglucosamine-6-phosphate deacetylase